ncbi:uncharacterized protein A4U43_C01F18120 [Asparagus officinalis]|uniref:Uncharacterized protein n=1 Tax=Asparagus officinalis TaxID=4686 RepID=A0A5P1FQ96_ASPOF|nr:uncharacterized protein A4U43_C01F18120 [Asparagus officinalis]
MGTPETSREPCPDRILDDVGGAFGMGAVGGFASGGGLFSGFDVARWSAAFGGVLLALIEGAGIMLNRVLSNPQNFPPMEDPGMVMPPNVPQAEVGGSGIPLSYQNRTQTNPTDKESTGSSSWLGGLFGKKEDVKSSSDGGEKTLESFDAPSVPTFEFKGFYRMDSETPATVEARALNQGLWRLKNLALFVNTFLNACENCENLMCNFAILWHLWMFANCRFLPVRFRIVGISFCDDNMKHGSKDSTC